MGYKITSKGQVTLPKAIRKHLGVSEGGAVEFEIEPDGDVVVRPIAKAPAFDEAAFRKALEAFAGSLNFGGLTANEYYREIRDRDLP